MPPWPYVKKKKIFFHQKLEPSSKHLPTSFTISLLYMAYSNKNKSFIKFLSYSSLAEQVILETHLIGFLN